MGEMYIKGRWKGKEKKVSNTFSPMIGMIYQSNNNVGVLVAIEDEVATLKSKSGSLIKVHVQSLKVIINDE